MTTEQQPPIDYLQQLAAAINEQASPSVPFEKQLWDAGECAKYLKRSRQVFMERYAPMPSFPKRIRLPNINQGRSQPLWKAKEVVEWAFRHQEKR